MTKFVSQGAILNRGAAVGATAVAVTTPATEVYTAIGQIENITGPSLTKANIDVTTLDDLAKTFLSDLPEPGELTFSIYLDGTIQTHQDLFADAAAQDRIRRYQVIVNDDAVVGDRTLLDFTAEVLSWSPTFETGAGVKVDLSVQVSGAITPTWHA